MPLDRLVGRLAGPVASFLPRPHDGKVSVTATHVTGESDHLTLPVSHALLPFHTGVKRQMLNFLRNGRFSRKAH